MKRNDRIDPRGCTWSWCWVFDRSGEWGNRRKELRSKNRSAWENRTKKLRRHRSKYRQTVSELRKRRRGSRITRQIWKIEEFEGELNNRKDLQLGDWGWGVAQDKTPGQIGQWRAKCRKDHRDGDIPLLLSSKRLISAQAIDASSGAFDGGTTSLLLGRDSPVKKSLPN